jgi:hypothetical protein
MTMIQTEKPFTVPAVTGKKLIRTGSDFTDGLCCGYLSYFDEYAGLDMKDTDVRPLLLKALNDGRYSETFAAGFACGIIEALLQDRKPLDYIPQAG